MRASLASTETALQEALAALEPKQSALASERVTLELARKALEAERRARSETDQEVLVLRGRVMETEEVNTRLCVQATRQANELSALENSHAGTFPFFLHCIGFFLQHVPDLVAPLSELDGKVKTLERGLETTKVTLSQNAEELAKSHEERRALDGDLD